MLASSGRETKCKLRSFVIYEWWRIPCHKPTWLVNADGTQRPRKYKYIEREEDEEEEKYYKTIALMGSWVSEEAKDRNQNTKFCITIHEISKFYETLISLFLHCYKFTKNKGGKPNLNN